MAAFRREATAHLMTWVTGASLALALVLILGLFALIAWNGLTYFWPKELVRFELEDGRVLLGEIHELEERLDGSPRLRLRIGNRELTGLDFTWIDTANVVERSRPSDVWVLERLEWGPFYGRFVEIRREGEVLARGRKEVRRLFRELHEAKRSQWERIEELEESEIGDVNHAIEELRLARKRLDREDLPEPTRRARETRIEAEVAALQREYDALAERLGELRREHEAETLVMETAGGREEAMPVSTVVRAIPANRLSVLGKLRVFAARGWEFLSAEPRESNTEGGIFPAIFGTVMMVFLMSIAVVPLGVIAAVYLREYAREGLFVRLVRIAVNNLAGVPSIVFGVFGLGFFVYLAGGSIDRLFYPESLPTPTYGTGGILWASLTLALLTVPVVIVASEEGLAAVPRSFREGSRALGATHFETLWRVVLPSSLPGILTGVVLAMARAAGEVAPLMIVGMVKLAPALPVDHHFPFIHPERKFMHLGFHIYDVGFQSPNVEAAEPLVFATALLLVAIVFALNLTAIVVRERLRSRYRSETV